MAMSPGSIFKIFLSIFKMSPVEFKKGQCRPVEFKGHGPSTCETSYGVILTLNYGPVTCRDINQNLSFSLNGTPTEKCFLIDGLVSFWPPARQETDFLVTAVGDIE